MDQPTAEVWPARAAWNAAAEAGYSDFIAQLGSSIAAGRCRRLVDCLRDPAINPLFEPGAERLRFHADCADVPYILRAYYAFHHDLPFAHARSMHGRGRDARYYRDAQPSGLQAWLDAATPRRLFEGLGRIVHSGFFRTAPQVESADFYQLRVDRQAVRPGTMFYDPNGHIVVVYDLRPSGEVRFFDGHPDGYLTHGTLSEKNERGGVSQGGGFKNFRPIHLAHGAIVQSRNRELTDYGGTAPFDRSRYQVQGQAVSFHAWLKSQLALPVSADLMTTGSGS